MSKHVVGSLAFFAGMDGFNSENRNYLILVDNPQGFSWRREKIMRGICTYEYKKESPSSMIAKTIENGEAMLLGKFLVPSVANAIGATINDIKPIEKLLPKLDAKHKYLETIYNAYKVNGDFTLTDEQRASAFAIYQESHNQNHSYQPQNNR